MPGARYTVAVLGPLLDNDHRVEEERPETVRAELRSVRAAGECDLIAHCAEARCVMAFGLFPFTARVFGALPRLRFLQQCTVGYDRVDVEAATRHGVMVANSPRFCSEEVSDHA